MVESDTNQSPILNELVGYDPGELPSRPAPNRGDTVTIEVDGKPPHKDVSFSIRNQRHRAHRRFKKLRDAGTSAMDGRAWYVGPVSVQLTVHGPTDAFGRRLNDYLGGVLDTLDGSSGSTFTFLPIVFEDDCQVAAYQVQRIDGDQQRYSVVVEFL